MKNKKEKRVNDQDDEESDEIEFRNNKSNKGARIDHKITKKENYKNQNRVLRDIEEDKKKTKNKGRSMDSEEKQIEKSKKRAKENTTASNKLKKKRLVESDKESDSDDQIEIDPKFLKKKIDSKIKDYGEKPIESLQKEMTDILSNQINIGIREMFGVDDDFSAGKDGDTDCKPTKSTQNTNKMKEDQLRDYQFPQRQLPAIPIDLPGMHKLTRAEQVAIMQHFAMVQPSRPYICLLHIFFKVTAVLSYLFLGFVYNSNMIQFLVSFGSMMVDFWITKNLTGRLLVGMRWWSDEDDESSESGAHKELLFYESYDADLNFHSFDTSIFWGGMVGSCGFWLFVALGKVLSLDLLWGMVTVTGLLLNWTNLKSYYKCYKFHKLKVTGRRDGQIGFAQKFATLFF